MFNIKSQVFNYLSKHQKSEICRHIQIFTRKYNELTTEDILDKFIEDETYYLEINQSRMEWISDYIEDETFISDAQRYIKHNKYKLEQEEKLKPLKEKQKLYLKEQRKKAQEYKMSKEPATAKQISFYKKLCKKYNLKELDFIEETPSKLTLRDEITKILNECSEYML